MVPLQCEILERKQVSGAKRRGHMFGACSEQERQHHEQPLLELGTELSAFRGVMSFKHTQSGARSVMTPIYTLHQTHSWLKSVCSQCGKPLDASLVCS